MDAELVGPIIVAIIGGAGIPAFAGGLIQFSRTARASRLIDHFVKALKDIPAGPGEDTLKVALERERLRLAAISIVRPAPLIRRLPKSTRDSTSLARYLPSVLSAMASVIVAIVAMVVEYTNDESMLRSPDAVWVAVAVAALLVAVIVVAFDVELQRRRAEFVRAAEADPAHAAELARTAQGE
jgi:hypothetical protein